MNPALACDGRRASAGRDSGAIGFGDRLGALAAPLPLTRVRPLHASARFGVAAVRIGVVQGIAGRVWVISDSARFLRRCRRMIFVQCLAEG